MYLSLNSWFWGSCWTQAVTGYKSTKKAQACLMWKFYTLKFFQDSFRDLRMPSFFSLCSHTHPLSTLRRGIGSLKTKLLVSEVLTFKQEKLTLADLRRKCIERFFRKVGNCDLENRPELGRQATMWTKGKIMPKIPVWYAHHCC